MSTIPTLEEQIAPAGITYAYVRRHGIFYRTGLVIQVLGSALLAVLYPLENPFYSIGIMLFEAGVLLSAIYLLAWMSWIKKTVIAFALGGMALQVSGFYAPEEYAGSIIISGIGIVCIGAAGMASKEALCFKYYEGWLLMPGFPFMVLTNLLGKENSIFNSVGFSILFFLLLFLTGRKLRKSLLSSCSSANGDMPSCQSS